MARCEQAALVSSMLREGGRRLATFSKSINFIASMFRNMKGSIMSTFNPVPEDVGANVNYRTDAEARALLPASFQTSAYERRLPFDSIFEFLHYELSVRRLKIISKHLWLAGRPRDHCNGANRLPLAMVPR
jgi:hypothetical protein